MPETFPVIDPDTGARHDVVHYGADELADMLHVHESTVSRLMRRDRWPHLAVGKRAWFTDADIAAVVSIMRRNDDVHLPPGTEAEPAPLGLVIPPGDDDAAEDV